MEPLPSHASTRSRRSIATGRGDTGQTDLLTGQRVSKTHPQIEALGAADELTSALGLVRAASLNAERRSTIESIQRDLIAIMAEIACDESAAAAFVDRPSTGFADDRLVWVNKTIESIEAGLPAVHDWIIPGASPESAALEFARATARRAERRMVALSEHGRFLRPVVLTYCNRVSDLLWLLARQSELPSPHA